MRRDPIFGVAAALLALHAVLWTTSALGVPWSRPFAVLLWSTAAGFAAWSIAPSLRAFRKPEPRILRRPPFVSAELTPLELGVAGLGVAAFGALVLASWQGWNVHPDWVFHWGPKAQRFALAGGIDLDYLTRPWNLHVHPDYPTLLPNLTASLALALETPVTPRLGTFSTILFAALWLVALRALAFRLAGRHTNRWAAEAAWLTAAWSVTMFATGFRQAAGADLPFACAVTLGALALSTPREDLQTPSIRPDLEVGLAAALASQVKFEGAVFALVLVALWCVRRGFETHSQRRLRRLSLHRLRQALLGAALLPAVLVGTWALWNQHHGLFLPSNAGGLALARLGTVAQGLVAAASERAWHGLPFLLVTLPWLCLRRRTRWPGLLLGGQFGAYVGVYLTTPVDLDLLLLTSGSRLLFHLVPTLLVLLVLTLGSDQEPEPEAESELTGTSSDEPVSPTFLA